MRLNKLILLYAAAALILVPVLAAQTEQATDTATKAEKKAKKRAKKTEEQSSEATGAVKDKGANATPETPATGKAKTTGSAHRMMPTVSDSEIAAAKASGQVWVNTQTGVYHTGGKWYGATKQGKFMSEDEAKKAGYRAAKNGQ
jgi:hypothetical protein